LSAAIEVLADIVARRRPAADALKDWGLARRFAGSKDRAAIASLVYDALRRRASAAWIMGRPRFEEALPRDVLLGSLRLARGMSTQKIGELCDGSRFAPAPLSSVERQRLDAAELSLADAPAFVMGDFPEWLSASLESEFGVSLVLEMQALARRAPLDLRVSTLKGTREEAMAALAHLGPVATPFSPVGIRLAHGEDGRGPSVQTEPAFLGGLVEIQDEGSQLVSFLAGMKPGETAIDLCAGGGGKTLALASLSHDEGRIIATDEDQRRLAPIHARLQRSGARNVEVRTPRHRGDEPLAGLEGGADLVLVDAPCTGVGTWRRNPDAKWRVRPGSLDRRLKEQEVVLERAARFAKPSGRIAYITCSLLPQENAARVASFLHARPDWRVWPRDRLVAGVSPRVAGLAVHGARRTEGLLLTPARSGTDGFFLSVLERSR
ncbi:MAG: RsmB/NOP family class I SAM-dependent RNA methyltransferase, partial [Hyphomicrobiales bacterium]|nr:RsmB/NOP family class I SAM-dependent RNA methyltransferase [Hyphomicrobiales bacterium]